MIFKNSTKWSPWAEKSDDTEYRFEGPAQGVGSIMRWSSENPEVGNGSQEITASVPYSSLQIELNIDGMDSCQSSYTLEPKC